MSSATNITLTKVWLPGHCKSMCFSPILLSTRASELLGVVDTKTPGSAYTWLGQSGLDQGKCHGLELHSGGPQSSGLPAEFHMALFHFIRLKLHINHYQFLFLIR